VQSNQVKFVLTGRPKGLVLVQSIN